MKDLIGPARSAPGSRLAQLSLHSDASSRRRDWQGAVVDLHKWTGPGDVTSPALDHDIVAMRLSGSTRLIQRRDGKIDDRVVTVGKVTAHPRGMAVDDRQMKRMRANG